MATPVYEGSIMLATFLLRARDFLDNEDGPTAVEYAVMLALIVVVCLSAITSIGTTTSRTFSKISSAISSS
jgi:pilus assembly protein Flp/PilA